LSKKEAYIVDSVLLNVVKNVSRLSVCPSSKCLSSQSLVFTFLMHLMLKVADDDHREII